MATVSTLAKAQMLQRAAFLAAGEHSEEAWYLVHLFQSSQPRELLRMCHLTLANFLELSYEYFDEGWPMQSRLESSTFHTLPWDLPANWRQRRVGERFRSRSPMRKSPAKSGHQDASSTPKRSHCADLTNRDSFLTPKVEMPRSSKKLAWLKTKYLLPSMVSIFTPPSTSISNLSAECPSDYLGSSPPAIATVKGTPFDVAHLRATAKPLQCSFYPQNPDLLLCQYIVDFMVNSPDLLSAEGLFRRPGNLSRIKQLYTQLKSLIIHGYLDSLETSSPTSESHAYCVSDRVSTIFRDEIYCALSPSPIYDVAGVLLRCLSSAIAATTATTVGGDASRSILTDTGIIPLQATTLLVQVTRLQYHLKDACPVYTLDPSKDWVHLLCHGRQLLAYRIIIQLLLPVPERLLLLKLLSLLHKVASNTTQTRMSAEALARCLAVAVFGLPEDNEAMGWYIDTLVNLIELFEELETLPKTIYLQVREFLKSNLGSIRNAVGAIHHHHHHDGCSQCEVDKSALKRSWATYQATTGDMTTTDMTSGSLAATSKENRSLLLCLWSRNSTEDQRCQTTSKHHAAVNRLRDRSPFLVWRKQRSAVSMKKSKSLCFGSSTGRRGEFSDSPSFWN